VGHGYAAAEPVWNTGGAPWIISRFNLIHPKNINFLDSLVPLVITADQSQGVAPQSFQLIYHRAAARSGHDTRNGVLRVCAYMYLFKNYAMKDWAAFNEIFGMPLRLGKYEPSATPADREALRAAISSLGSDAAGIISKSTEIEFIEASQRLSGVTNPYEVMTYFCNREISKAVLGQTLTTDTQGSTGTYAAGRVQAEVRRDLLEADAEMLSETIREQLLRPLVGFNFGWDQPIPDFGLLIQDAPDFKADSEWLKNLAGIGMPITVSWVREHFGLPEAQGDEPVLQAPASGSPAGAPAEIPPSPPLPTGGKSPALRAVLPLRAADGDAHPGLVLLPQDREVIGRIQELDELAAQALAAADTEVMRMLAPVKQLIETGQSLEEIRDRLLAFYSQLEVEGLVNLIHEARMRAWMRGRSGE
jgi:phage gp29-like protein